MIAAPVFQSPSLVISSSYGAQGAPAAPASNPPPPDLVVERSSAVRFVYTKVNPITGEEVWRWPHGGRARDGLGELLDVAV